MKDDLKQVRKSLSALVPGTRFIFCGENLTPDGSYAQRLVVEYNKDIMSEKFPHVTQRDLRKAIKDGLKSNNTPAYKTIVFQPYASKNKVSDDKIVALLNDVEKIIGGTNGEKEKSVLKAVANHVSRIDRDMLLKVIEKL